MHFELYLPWVISTGVIVIVIIAGFQTQIDALNAAATKIAALVASQNSGTLPPGAASATDVADTLAAVTKAADGVTAALTPPASGGGTPPSALTLTPASDTGQSAAAGGTGVSGSFEIAGGEGPYTVTSSSAGIVPSVNGNTVSYTGSPASAEDVSLTVADSTLPVAETATFDLAIS